MGNRGTAQQEGLSRAGLTRPACMAAGKQQQMATWDSSRTCTANCMHEILTTDKQQGHGEPMGDRCQHTFSTNTAAQGGRLHMSQEAADRITCPQGRCTGFISSWCMRRRISRAARMSLLPVSVSLSALIVLWRLRGSKPQGGASRSASHSASPRCSCQGTTQRREARLSRSEQSA